MYTSFFQIPSFCKLVFYKMHTLLYTPLRELYWTGSCRRGLTFTRLVISVFHFLAIPIIGGPFSLLLCRPSTAYVKIGIPPGYRICSPFFHTLGTTRATREDVRRYPLSNLKNSALFARRFCRRRSPGLFIRRSRKGRSRVDCPPFQQMHVPFSGPFRPWIYVPNLI